MSTRPTPALEPPLPPPPKRASARPNVLKYLYTRNPFYVISAVLMLFAVKSAYGELEIGRIDSSLMIGVLAGYTLVLAGMAVVLVRWGRVWDDARSLLLLLVVFFLAVSVCADDLFVNAREADTTRTAIVVLVCGFLFSSLLSELVLHGSGIRLGARLRVPYHALLALFFAAPWGLSSNLVGRDPVIQSWLLLAFPAVAGVLFLMLWPAARSGPAYSRDNGTPYPWPWFPWTVFGLFAAAVAFRSYVLTMTYGLVGPIWSLDGAIVFDTIWGPYFLVPLALALLVLVLETGLVTGSHPLQRRVLWAAPVLVLLALPWLRGEVHRSFVGTVTETLGSPLWLCTWSLVGFYGWAALRRVPEAVNAALSATLLFVLVGPRTVDAWMLLDPNPWPLVIVGTVLFAVGVVRRSSVRCALAITPLACGLWFALGETSWEPQRVAVTFHVVWLMVVTLGLVFRDDFARGLRVVGSLLTVGCIVQLVNGEFLATLPWAGRVAYVCGVGVVCLVVARLWRSRSYLYACYAIALIGGYSGTVLGFRAAVEVFGRWAVTAFAWSVGTLLLGFLISAHKARWITPPPLGTAKRGSREPEATT